jgi:hypothetical protein
MGMTQDPFFISLGMNQPNQTLDKGTEKDHLIFTAFAVLSSMFPADPNKPPENGL